MRREEDECRDVRGRPQMISTFPHFPLFAYARASAGKRMVNIVFGFESGGRRGLGARTIDKGHLES